MFQTAEGVQIPFPEKIKEEYQVLTHSIRLNLSFEKIKPMLLDFIDQTQEPLFIVLQLPLSRQEEEKIRKSDADPLHRKVCYMDGLTKEQVEGILGKYGELILNDGISQFAVASHVNGDDFFIQKYKLIDLFSNPTSKYAPLMKKYGVTETSDLFTVWDTFSQETPGECSSIKRCGKNIYQVYDELVQQGMYEAKIVEE